MSQAILITGAAGFLGSHLTDLLLGEGHTVVGVDNLCTGNTANLAHLDNESRFRFVEQDICQPFDVGRVDYVFNFASPASPVDYDRLGPETLLVGSTGTVNTLNCRNETSGLRSRLGRIRASQASARFSATPRLISCRSCGTYSSAACRWSPTAIAEAQRELPLEGMADLRLQRGTGPQGALAGEWTSNTNFDQWIQLDSTTLINAVSTGS